MSDEMNETSAYLADSRKYFADVIGLPRRGRPSNISEEKYSDTQCRFRLNLRQERIVKQLCKEHGISVQDVGRKFFDEGMKLWINKGRDKFDLSNKVKKIYRETIEESVLPISNQVSLLHDKLDSFADETVSNFEAVLVQTETVTPHSNSNEAEATDKGTLEMVLMREREILAQNELLISMIGSILKMTPRFQTGTGNDAKIDTEEFNKFMDKGRKQAQTDADELIGEDDNDKG
jgi:hypothetical protein